MLSRVLVRKIRLTLLICLTVISFSRATDAQDTQVAVPDVRGLSVPAAAAILNRSGLALGAETSIAWTSDSALPPHRIVEQAIPAGQTVERGTAVGITVARPTNALLIFDANQLTFINRTGATLDLNKITFRSLDGTTPADFAANRWAVGMPDGDCMQMWSVDRAGSRGLDECPQISRWLWTGIASEHFWTGANGAAHFALVQDGVERGVCETAAPGGEPKRCEVYLPGSAAAEEVTAYVYFAYTADRLVVLNQSSDQWMPLSATVVHNYNPNLSVPGASLILGDPALFNTSDIVATIERLAPGQCLLFTNHSPDATSPPQPCDVIARLDIDPTLIFWAADFEVDSATDDQNHICRAATPGRLTICAMPR